MAEPLLSVRDLSIGYRDAWGNFKLAVDGLSFDLAAGGSIGIVGESGSGKSTAARALLGHYRGASERSAGQVFLSGQRLDESDPNSLKTLRGIQVAFVPQNPLSSLTHHLRVGDQLVEILCTRAGLDRNRARRHAIELMEKTRLPNPKQLFARYPHQLSGGQRQRVVIACALACKPRLLVLDEPTTALDKTTEAQVLDLVRDLQQELGVALVLVTHDLNVVARMCTQVLVMKNGRTVEQGSVEQVFGHPSQPYTKDLLGSVLRLDRPPPTWVDHAMPPVLELNAVGHRYRQGSWLIPKRAKAQPALQAISQVIRTGEVLGLIGESGSGKSTLGSAVAGLLKASDGEIRFKGKSLAGLSRLRRPDERRRIQIIFQDPLSSLNPRQRIGTAVARPIEVFTGVGPAEARRRAAALLADLGLDASYMDRFPRQLSGGQQQRVAIARAFAADPELIVCDEITSALDATMQSQVLDALRRLQVERGVSLLLITHDLAVVWSMAQRVVVLHNGHVQEAGDTQSVFANPRTEYTRALLASSTRAVRLEVDQAKPSHDAPRVTTHAEAFAEYAMDSSHTRSKNQQALP